MKHIKKIKPAAQDPIRTASASSGKGEKQEPRLLKDLRPCIPVDGQ